MAGFDGVLLERVVRRKFCFEGDVTGLCLGELRFQNGASIHGINEPRFERGLMLVGVALRLLRIREIAVADLLPGLVVAPLLVSAVAAFR